MTANPPGLSLVTGATGLLGSHIAEKLRARGDRVRALVRPGTPTTFLDAIGVEVFRGDLSDPAACRGAAEGADFVYHSAAKVGDWGTWGEFQVGCLDATRNIAEAALAGGAKRFVQISSTSAYGHPKEGGPPIDETAPLGQNLWRFWDYYTISKVESERLLWDLAETRGLPLTIIRPSWLYGERDRITMARLIAKLRAGTVPWIGPATNPISAIYAPNVADAAILAAGHEGPGARRTTSPIKGSSPSRTTSTSGSPPPAHRRSKRDSPTGWSSARACSSRPPLGSLASRGRP